MKTVVIAVQSLDCHAQACSFLLTLLAVQQGYVLGFFLAHGPTTTVFTHTCFMYVFFYYFILVVNVIVIAIVCHIVEVTLLLCCNIE